MFDSYVICTLTKIFQESSDSVPIITTTTTTTPTTTTSTTTTTTPTTTTTTTTISTTPYNMTCNSTSYYWSNTSLACGN